MFHNFRLELACVFIVLYSWQPNPTLEEASAAMR